MPRASQETVKFTTAGQKYTGVGVYTGVKMRETSGAAGAVVRIFDGTDNTGRLLDELTFLANESTREGVGGGAEEAFATGLYVEIVSGAIEGILLFRDS